MSDKLQFVVSFVQFQLRLPNLNDKLKSVGHKALTSQRTPKIHFAAVCCFAGGGAFFTYLSNQLIRSARMCSSVCRPA